jgi:hypothetical protein
VCGHERRPGDALRILPGPVDGRDGVVAATWTPHESLALDDADVVPAAIAAALDCPTGWAQFEPGGVALLGRLALRHHRPLTVGRTYVVVAERGRREGRKLHAAAALYDAAGTLHAESRAVWISVA